MADGSYEVSSVPAHKDYLVAAAAILRDAGLEDHTEIKPGGVAVHWRGLDPGESREIGARSTTALEASARSGSAKVARI